MKKIVLLLILVTVFVFPQKVLAHVLKYDGSIGAVLHVTPEDDPIAGEESNFYFEFKDKNSKFLPENCDCRAFVIKDGVELHSQNLFEGATDPSLINTSFSYTFPSKGIYEVLIKGLSKDGSFEKFSLKYDIRVARGVGNSVIDTSVEEDGGTQGHLFHTTLGILTFGILLLILYRMYRK